MHLADRLELPDGYRARRYRGAVDHPLMVPILVEYREHLGDPEFPTVEQFDLSYAHLDDCDPDLDIALVEHLGRVVAYTRSSFEDNDAGELPRRDLVVFAPTRPAHLAESLFVALTTGQEAHMLERWPDRTGGAGATRFRAYAGHPGPGLHATGEAAWLEALGYATTEWGASLVRPHLDDVPDRPLPDGVEIRPATPDQLRAILTAHFEAFRDEWDYTPPTESDYVDVIDDPHRDESLWQIAWAGDQVVGQVKPYIEVAENAARGYARGYTEDISTHRDWRNRGVAGALLARSLHALRERGMTEAALGVDVNNPQALHLYTSLGFEVRSYEAVYTKPVPMR